MKTTFMTRIDVYAVLFTLALAGCGQPDAEGEAGTDRGTEAGGSTQGSQESGSTASTMGASTDASTDGGSGEPGTSATGSTSATSSGSASTTTTGEETDTTGADLPATQDELIERAESLIEELAARLQDAGVATDFVPRVEIGGQPLPFYNGSATDPVIMLTWWQSSGASVQADFEQWAEWSRDYEDAEALYGDLYYWYVIVHEGGHWARHVAGAPGLPPWSDERFANQVAVAFLREYDPERLDRVMRAKADVLAQMDDPTPPGQTPEQYFNTNYGSLAQMPDAYVYYQFSMTVSEYDDPQYPSFEALATSLATGS